MRLKKKQFIIPSLFVLVALFIVTFYRPDVPVEKLLPKYTDEDSRFLEIDHVKVHYKDEGTGMPLILLHGTASSLHTWDAWAKQLKPYFRVIRMDLPAFGITGPDPDGDYTIAYYVSFLEKFTEALDIDSCYLAGNSLGGLIAWSFASTHPDKVKKLILIDAAGFSVDRQPLIFRLAKTPVINRLLSKLTPKFIIRKNLLEVYADDRKVTAPLVDRYYQLQLREGNRNAFIKRIKAGYVVDTNALEKLSMPVLVQWGAEDSWIPPAHAEKFRQHIPNARIAIYENAGHVPMEEIPFITARDALEFLSE